jgi:hypothetical protein
VALGIVGGLTHMRCVEVLEVAVISLFVWCLFLYGGCSTCDDALGEMYSLYFNILILKLDFYLVSAYTAPIFVTLRCQLCEKVSF